MLCVHLERSSTPLAALCTPPCSLKSSWPTSAAGPTALERCLPRRWRELPTDSPIGCVLTSCQNSSLSPSRVRGLPGDSVKCNEQGV